MLKHNRRSHQTRTIEKVQMIPSLNEASHWVIDAESASLPDLEVSSFWRIDKYKEALFCV